MSRLVEWRIAMLSVLAEVDWNSLLDKPYLLAVVAVSAIVGGVALGAMIAG